MSMIGLKNETSIVAVNIFAFAQTPARYINAFI